MRFSRTTLYTFTILLTVFGVVFVAAGEYIITKPSSFETTRDQRRELYSSTWQFSGKFQTKNEILRTYIYELSTTHSFTVNLNLEAISASQTRISINSITTDNLSWYGFWYLDVRIYDATTDILIANIIDFISYTTVIVGEHEAYKFIVSGEYFYQRCVSGSIPVCEVGGPITKFFSTTAVLNLENIIWKGFREGYQNLALSVTAVLVFILFSIEYGMNYKERSKTFKIISGISYGATGVVFIYTLVYVFIALANSTIARLKAPQISVLVIASLHAILNIFEWQYAKYDQPEE